MLVLTRQPGQTIMIGDEVFVTVERITSDGAGLGIYAPAAMIAQVLEPVLQRRANAVSVLIGMQQDIHVGPDVRLRLVVRRDDRVRLGIECPPELPVHRKEVYDAIKRENPGHPGMLD